MNAASLQKAGSPPVAAAPSGGVTPMDGQGFVPAAGASSAGAAQAGAPSADGSLPAEQALQALMQVLGTEYGEPIIAADGTVYMEKKKPDVANGSLALSYAVVGKIDKATGKMKINPEILAKVKAKSEAAGGEKKKLVKVDDSWVWQTFSKTEDGKVVAEVTPASDAEVQAYQQQQAAAQAQQAAQAKTQDRGDWQQKIGVVAQHMGLFGSAGQLVSGLSSGPNPYTGKPGAGWISGWILAQRLNGKAEGKLLPSWMQSGPVATALEWGIQAYGMLDMGNDFRVVRDFLGKKPPLPGVNPGAVQQLIAQGHSPAVAGALAGLGAELRVPLDATKVGAAASQLVEGSANTTLLRSVVPAIKDGATGAMIAGAPETALTMVPKKDLHAAFAATDPVQSAGMKLRGNIDGGVAKGLGMLKGLIQPAMMGATALGLISSTITVKNLTEKNGAKVLVNTQQGRGALLGALSSAAFLGLYTLPMILPGLGMAGAAVAAASSAVNIVSNVLGGVQMLNSYGLFGGDGQKPAGFLDNDAFRGAFLIPPLTPIGAFAFWMKSKKKKQAQEAARMEAAQKLAVERIQQQREMAKLQLQSTGQISGAVQGKDGAVIVPTNVPNDLSQLAAQLGGSAPPGA
ncbi:MAG: hypothetical protein JWM86_386, partial [Thermoleophilia bacterium]|nr:hypothetical protein [Thermoleophilia bacterium]